MFAIALEQQQYKTYILSDETTSSRLEVVPERGGIITRWQVQGQDLLYLDTERFTNPALSVRGGIPILFPICGNLPDNTYTYQNQKYTLKQHGFARDLPWEVTDQQTDQSAGLTLTLKSNETTIAVYPFDFHLAFTYQIQGNSLEIVQQYTNHSSEPMPFSTGLHPYFSAPDKTQLHFAIPAIQFTDQRTQRNYPFHGTFDFEEDEIDSGFSQLTGLAAQVTDYHRRVRIALSYNSSYSTLVFWTLKGKDFYCLEPWSSPRNALNTGKYLLHLEPGGVFQTIVRISANFF